MLGGAASGQYKTALTGQQIAVSGPSTTRFPGYSTRAPDALMIGASLASLSARNLAASAGPSHSGVPPWARKVAFTFSLSNAFSVSAAELLPVVGSPSER